MSEYHVGAGAFAIYAGTLNSRKDKWQRKSDVTEEATAAVAQYLLDRGKVMRFVYQGKKYKLCVMKEADHD